jgi:hypothetical protein
LARPSCPRAAAFGQPIARHGPSPRADALSLWRAVLPNLPQNMIWSLTEVPPERLKILGLTTSKLQPDDSMVMAELKIKKGGRFMCLGACART